MPVPPKVSPATTDMPVALNVIVLGLGFRKSLRLSFTTSAEWWLYMLLKSSFCQAAAESKDKNSLLADVIFGCSPWIFHLCFELRVSSLWGPELDWSTNPGFIEIERFLCTECYSSTLLCHWVGRDGLHHAPLCCMIHYGRGADTTVPHRTH